MLDAAREGDISAVQRSLDDGADPNYLTSDGGATPLTVAAVIGNADVADVLLQRGATVGLRITGGYAAIDFAVVFGHVNVLKVLLNAGADPNEINQEGYNPIHLAAAEGGTQLMQELVNAGGNISLKSGGNTSGGTALHIAARNSRLSMVKLLLSLGAQVDVKSNSNGITPLYLAATADAGSVLLVLIEAGADVNEKNNSGVTALGAASFWGNQQSVEVLLENGADKTLIDSDGRAPFALLCRCTLLEEIPSYCQVETCESPRRLVSLLEP